MQTKELLLDRIKQTKTETLGKLYLDKQLLCHTLEDISRPVKVAGQTRIPAGRYEIKLRTVGGTHERYKKKFTFHKGMLWLQRVPGYDYILIHIGNTHKDTEGCMLVGENYTESQGQISLQKSTLAYINIYQTVLHYLQAGQQVFITINDEGK